MMQAADLRDGDYLPNPARRDRARVRTILVEREMSATALVVGDVRGQDAAQMTLVENQDVIQTLAANRTDYALNVRVLPG